MAQQDNTNNQNARNETREAELTYCLSKKMVIFLLVYLGILLSFGGFFVIEIIRLLSIKVTSEQILQYSFYGSISVSGMTSSIQYIKKLYKACITNRIDILDADEIKRIGNFSYFFFRPFFACGFSIIMVCAALSGMFIVTGSLDYILNEKFVYMCVIMASFLGYSIGKLMDRFGHMSIQKINDLQ